MRAFDEVDRARKDTRDSVLQREPLLRAPARADFACSRSDVPLDTDVTERFAESAAHGEDSELDIEFFTTLVAAHHFARVFACCGQLVCYFSIRVFAEVECGRFPFEVVVGIAQEREMSTVLLEINAFRVGDGNRFAGMREDLTIKIGTQFHWSRSRLSMGFCGRHNKILKGKLQGWSDSTTDYDRIWTGAAERTDSYIAFAISTDIKPSNAVTSGGVPFTIESMNARSSCT